MKTCTKCKIEKHEFNFHRDKNRKDGLFPQCKECVGVSTAKYYLKNKDSVLAKNKIYASENKDSIAVKRQEYYLLNGDDILTKNKKYREKNKEYLSIKAKVRHEANRERDIERSKLHYEKNKDIYRERARNYYIENKTMCEELHRSWTANNPEKRLESSKKYNKKFRSTPKGNISSTISKRMNESLQKGMKAGRHWESLVDFTVDQLKIHLEKQFKPGMTWDNYGSYWHIDHKIPIAIFNFETTEDIEFHMCWSLKNLQPLEAIKNMSKGARIESKFHELLPINGGLK